MFDCHIHTDFSGDCETPPDLVCTKARELGLSGIAITDHLDIDYPDFDEKFLIDFSRYSKVIDRLKHQFSEELTVLKGIEIGYQPHVIKETEQILNSYDFDYVICSIHIIDQLDPYTGKYFNGKSKNEAFLRYLQLINESVTNYDNFDTIGHIGYLRRYCGYPDKSLRYQDFHDILDSILKTVIRKGKGIEVNTSGYRSGLDSPMPDYDIIKRYFELGGEMICIGSDAHYPEHIASQFQLVTQRLEAIGFQYLTHFEQRKPVFDKIK